MSTQGSVRVRCPHCRKVLTLPAALRGQAITCPNPDCRKSVTLRARPAPGEAPALPPPPAAAARPVPPPLPAIRPQTGFGGWSLPLIGGAARWLVPLIGGVAVLIGVLLWQVNKPRPRPQPMADGDVRQAMQPSAAGQDDDTPPMPKPPAGPDQVAENKPDPPAATPPGDPDTKPAAENPQPQPPAAASGPKPVGVARGNPGGNAPGVNVAQEYHRFAELASMEGCAFASGFDYTAPWRARKLQALRLTNPTLRRAADEFVGIATKYEIAVQMRNRSNWSPEELRALSKGLHFDNDEDLNRYFLRGLAGTAAKVKLLEMATELAFRTRVLHSRMWTRVLADFTPTGGPDQDKFPLHIGPMWIRNISGKTLTNLTVAIRTRSSAKLPDDATLHVVFFERLEPDEGTSLPSFLISKLVDNRTRTYKPAKDCFTCSVWSDQARFQDVPFDLRPTRPANSRARPGQGFFPGNGFRGTYDTTTPWARPRPSERYANLTGGVWMGQAPWTGREFHLKIGHVLGGRLEAIDYKATRETPKLFTGTVRDGKIELEAVVVGKNDPDAPPCWGTIDGDRMELRYGHNHVPEGTMSLRFVKSKPKGPMKAP